MNSIVIVALKRPYTFVVLAILILLYGGQSVFATPTDVFPNIKLPVVSVVWQYAGLMPADTSGRITYFYERALTSTVEGIARLESQSYYGSAIINIFLQPDIDLAGAEAEITAISQTVTNALPPDISPPMIMRLEASSVPVAMLQVTSESMSPADLYNIAISRIRPELVTIPGAILPHPYGGQPKQLLVSLDPQKLMSRHLTAEDVHAALKKQNIVLPAGDQKIRSTDFMVQTNASPLGVDDFNGIPIKRVGNAWVYLRDVADASLAGPPQTNAVLVDGKQAVTIVVMKSSTASTLDVVQGVKNAIPKIKRSIPGDIEIKVLNDASTFVKASIEDVLREMMTAAALTAIVVLLFLGSWRATVIIATCIPLSILTSIVCLRWLGESINIMTLGGLALAVGILVDNATVVIENIDTHLALKKPLGIAIVDAARQIIGPTFVSTLCIMIVWLPLFGLSGVAGYLFKPMAEAVMFAMAPSFILSLTLVPTMAKYLFAAEAQDVAEPEPGCEVEDPSTGNEGTIHADEAAIRADEAALREDVERLREDLAAAHGTGSDQRISHTEFERLSLLGRLQKGFERGFDRLRESYTAALGRAIARRGAFIVVFLVCALSSLALLMSAGRDFFPEVRSGTLQMHMRAPLGTRIEASGRIASRVADDIAHLLPDKVENVVCNCGLPVGPHNLAFIPTPTIGTQDCDLTISLKDESSPVWDYRAIVRDRLKEMYPGVEFTFQPADLTAKILNFGSPSPIDIRIKGMDMKENFEYARSLAARLETVSGASDVVIQQTMRTPTLLIEANRSLGLGMDLTEDQIAQNLLLNTSGSQQIDQSYWLDHDTGLSYQLNVYTPQPWLNKMEDLLTVPVSAQPGEAQGKAPLLLGNVASAKLVGTPGVVSHLGIQPLFDIYVSAEQRDLGGVLEDVQKIVDETRGLLPRSAALEIHGQAETMRSAYAELLLGLLTSVVLVYLLIVVNFQSWLDPFIIITALPGALAGVAWSLFITHTNISVPALTGAIMSIGTATANSILVVSYAKERLSVHGDAVRAATEAGQARIRPVLMTAAAIIIGMLPMALGNSQNAPLGRSVMGGLVVATFATLFLVPCVYAVAYKDRSSKPNANDKKASA